ncbi:hypothetical protein BGZ92_007270, partial [Podila epicladia]
MRFGINRLKDAIENAGHTKKAVVGGRAALSRLDKQERVSVLDYLGEDIEDDDIFAS